MAVEENLTKSVHIRQFLEKDPESRYLETIPKRGYRFVGTVTVEEAPSLTRAGAPTDSGAPPLENSIPVMPFSDMSAARDHEFFCGQRGRSSTPAAADLRVASYTSSFRFKGKAADPQTIGRELMVSWLLEGSVLQVGDMVGSRVRFVRAADGFSAWSGRFDRRLDDIFTVQDDIAGMIAQTLTQRVAKASAPLVTSTTSKTEAHVLYLEGRYLWNKRPGDVVWQALVGSNGPWPSIRAFAPARTPWPACMARWARGRFFRRPKRWQRPRRLQLVRWAGSAAGRGTHRGGLCDAALDGTEPGMPGELDQAIALNPAWVDAHHWHFHALCAAGRFAESLAACRRIVELDPLNPADARARGVALLHGAGLRGGAGPVRAGRPHGTGVPLGALLRRVGTRTPRTWL